MRAAFTSDIARLTDHHDGRTDLVAVQGAVSSMKTWLLACTAEEFLTRAQRVAALVPSGSTAAAWSAAWSSSGSSTSNTRAGMTSARGTLEGAGRPGRRAHLLEQRVPDVPR